MNLPDHIRNPNAAIYHSGNYVVLDFETTVKDHGSALNPHNSIVLAVWQTGPGHPYRTGKFRSKWGDEFKMEALVRDIQAADFLVAHNAKFELQWLERCGLDLTSVVVWDTMIGEYVIGGNRWVGHRLSLERIAQRRYNEGKVAVISKLYKAGLCSTEIPASWLQRYCERDVELTHRLFLDQLKDMRGTRLLPVMYTRCLATPVFADIEKNGMHLDHDLIRIRLREVEREYAELEHKLVQMTGGINLNSPAQMGVFLYDTMKFPEPMRRRGGRMEPDRTPAGGRRTDADTVAALKPRSKKQRDFLELYGAYKKVYNELTKYLRKFDECCKNDGGMLHATFNQTTTQTHRTSSSGAKYRTQFQNFPRSYKGLFSSRQQGWQIGEVDGAQLEFRAAAHLGRDSVGVSDIVDGVDIHSVTAGVIGCTRQEAKAHTFKPLYGGQSGTKDEVRYYQFFRDKYTGIAKTQQHWIDTVLDKKYLETEWGLRYYWPDTYISESGYVNNTTSICNYPVQAFATAEIIPIALVYAWHRIKLEGLSMYIVNTIHDSIIVELPDEEQEAFRRIMNQAMMEDVYRYLELVYSIHLTVPLGTGMKISDHWGQGAEEIATAPSHLWGAKASNYL